MSRRVRYNVAASLDGYIAGPGGEYDWIVHDGAIDFKALFAQFDALVMGRRTYDIVLAQPGGTGMLKGFEVVVFSRTLPASADGHIRITSDAPVATVRAMQAAAGKDIWLFGGGQLFRTLVDANLVDTVEVAVMPVLLGRGIPLLPGSTRNVPLSLTTSRTMDSGIVMLTYAVQRGAS